MNRQGKAHDGIEECNPQTRLGGEMSTFTEDWWNKSSSSLGVKIGLGHQKTLKKNQRTGDKKAMSRLFPL